ncbi:pentapeptide repeat-containing protein [Streptomyces sp. NPDC050535]|uniref:pentapeptide repeat-containing protein n=1 Tax=Streptomyces sp. NPDC050535 TaxID=3365626 RepID=UPI0037AFB3A4
MSGCRGVNVPGRTACLTHLAAAERDAYLASLTPSSSIDHRGTSFTPRLLRDLINALRDPATRRCRIGTARFESATFEGDAWFQGVIFEGEAHFGSATFEGDAWFEEATFEGDAWFHAAIFTGDAHFGSSDFTGNAHFALTVFKGNAHFELTACKGDASFSSAAFKADAEFGRASFESDAHFGSVTFNGTARFLQAKFEGKAWFNSTAFQGIAAFGSTNFTGDAVFGAAKFTGEAGFESANFTGDAEFGDATFQNVARFESATIQKDAKFERVAFERLAILGPLVCAGKMKLSGAEFRGPVTLMLAARLLDCRRTRWSSTAELRLRYAVVVFSQAVFEYPLTIATEPRPFDSSDGETVSEAAFIGEPATVRIMNLHGVDAAHLVISNVDLAMCHFTGTVHLDQIRLEGDCSFNRTPSTTYWRSWRPVRFTQRRTLFEEHIWRSTQPAAAPGWNTRVSGDLYVGPAQLAPVYRALRKAFEDGKNEPGAADFYYGEMEMRRHDRTGPTRAERGLLHGYWLLSGYGLRASRALGWLAAAMLITIVLLMGFGLPDKDPKQEATGHVPPGGGRVTFEIEKNDPKNPTGLRLTGKRFEKALNVTLNSVVFRSSGQGLTTAGTYIEMASRVTEPILLGLAVLAIRNRVKR